jgi:transketolase N-terminal domain/subunit
MRFTIIHVILFMSLGTMLGITVGLALGTKIGAVQTAGAHR